MIVDKDKRTVPFFLNDVQKSFIKDLNQAISDFKQGKRLHLKFLVLKGRQQGFTSLITAYQLACSITKRNFSGFTLADDAENTETIFDDKAKYPYSQLPEQLKPSEKYNNRREFHFDKINSRWRVATASGKGVGRSKTLNFFHGSEAGFWGDMQKIMSGLDPALTKDSIQILESTANGYNQFKELWDDENNWEGKFYEWWLTPEYRQSFESERIEREFKEQVQSSEQWIYQRCKWLVEFIQLSLEQVYWYYKKWVDLKELIKQEYPCSADEAFLASGSCVFDKDVIVQRKKYLEGVYKVKPPRRGYFVYERKDNGKIKDSSIRFVDSESGYIFIYQEPHRGFPYAIGGDTAGEGSNWFAAHVIENTSGQQVATLHHQFDEDLFAEQVYCLGKYYNYALVGIEVNYSTYPVKTLRNLGYGRQYVREVEDTITKKRKEAHGFWTSSITRPIIIANLVKLVRENIDLINDPETLKEMLTFVLNDSKKPEAEEGAEDDLVMALAISHYCREQQSYEATPMDGDEDYDDYYGDPEYETGFGSTGY